MNVAAVDLVVTVIIWHQSYCSTPPCPRRGLYHLPVSIEAVTAS